VGRRDRRPRLPEDPPALPLRRCAVHAFSLA
jgi:hypothetical protein